MSLFTKAALASFRGARAIYAGGGVDGSDVAQSNVYRWEILTEAVSTLASGLSSARSQAGAFNQFGVAGYISGGGSTTIDKWSHNSDSRSTLSTGLSRTRSRTTSLSNSQVAGYHGDVTDLDKFAFPTDTRSVIAQTFAGVTSFSNGATAGYGGRTNAFDKLSWTSDTKSTISVTMSVDATFSAGGMCQFGTAGYTARSQYKFALPAETLSTISRSISVYSYGWGETSEPQTAGYSIGERFNGGGFNYASQTVYKMTYATETESGVTNIPSGRGYLAGWSNA